MIDYAKKQVHDGEIGVLNIWQQAVLRLVPMAGKRIIDIGCGSGSFLKAVQPGAVSVLGVDPNPNNISILTQHAIPARLGYIHMFASELANKYDIATCFEVVEHLYDPWELCAGARTVLDNGGIFITTTPNAFHILRAFDFVFRQQHRDVLMDPTRTDIPEHVRLWSRGMLLRAFEKSGFRDAHCYGVSRIFGKTIILKQAMLVKWFAQNLICIGVK